MWAITFVLLSYIIPMGDSSYSQHSLVPYLHLLHNTCYGKNGTQSNCPKFHSVEAINYWNCLISKVSAFVTAWCSTTDRGWFTYSSQSNYVCSAICKINAYSLQWVLQVSNTFEFGEIPKFSRLAEQAVKLTCMMWYFRIKMQQCAFPILYSSI